MYQVKADTAPNALQFEQLCEARMNAVGSHYEGHKNVRIEDAQGNLIETALVTLGAKGAN